MQRLRGPVAEHDGRPSKRSKFKRQRSASDQIHSRRARLEKINEVIFFKASLFESGMGLMRPKGLSFAIGDGDQQFRLLDRRAVTSGFLF